MLASSSEIRTLRLKPRAGCGTLESPWTLWEEALESPGEGERAFLLPPGIYGVRRPVRMASGVRISGDPEADGRAWFLPAPGESPEALFLVEGVDAVGLSGVRLNGRGSGARHGVLVRGSQNVHLRDLRLEDFGDAEGSAIRIEGAAENGARSIVVQSCHFLSGSCGIALGRNASDLLVDDNRFEEISGPAARIDPQDEWVDYGLIFVKNRIRNRRTRRTGPCLLVRPGAEGMRIAENTMEAEPESVAGDHPGVDVEGGGPMSRRRVELLVNRIVGMPGAGIRARRCGPGFVAAGNEIVGCGAADCGAVDVSDSHGVLVEDNEIVEPRGAGVRVRDCSGSRLNGNEIEGGSHAHPRGGSVGLLVDGTTSRRIRVTDNRIRCVKEAGVLVESCAGVRLVGNEVEDCGLGIQVDRARNLVLVGNDCRDNGGGGIRVGDEVHRGLVALNYAILNGSSDLDVRGERIHRHSNKVDRDVSGTGPGGNEG